MGILISLAIGITLLSMGLSYTWDYTRYSYIFSSPWANGHRFASIPTGTFFLLINLFAFIDINSTPLFIVILYSVGFPLIALWFNFFPPKFLYPEWYKWIQKNHAGIWPLLREEAAKDYEQWYRETRTQEGLEAWVEKVRAEYGLDK